MKLTLLFLCGLSCFAQKPGKLDLTQGTIEWKGADAEPSGLTILLSSGTLGGTAIFDATGKRLADIDNDGKITALAPYEDVIRAMYKAMLEQFDIASAERQHEAERAAQFQSVADQYIKSLKALIAAQQKQIEIYKKGLDDIQRGLTHK